MYFNNLLVIFTIFLLIIPLSEATPLKIHFIDVGQGDSILLQSGGKNMLVDAGPGESGGKVVAYLRSQGVSTIDVIIATHPHEDHIGGMLDVLNNFNVGLYVDNGVTHTTSTYENLVNKLVDDQTPYAEVKAGNTIPFATGIVVSVISPTSISGDMNEDSIILKITDGTQKILLTGDSSLSPGDVQAQILKVPHHGSKHSSDSSYYRQVNPEVAVICVGRGNDFGHPSAEVISNIERAGASLFRTDKDGTVVISTDGNSWQVESSGMSSSSSKPSYQPIYQRTTSPTPIATQKSYTPFVAPVIVQPASTFVQNSQSSGSAPCNCAGPDLDCKDFSTRSEAQACFNYCKSNGYGDCFRMDRDNDGKVCESKK